MFKIGDRVSTRYKEHGIGTISQIYDDFSACALSCITMTGDEWLAAQEIPFTEEQLKEQWYAVSYKFGDFDEGACWSPESLLTRYE